MQDRWLFVPRATAAFYVPKRNQHLIRTTYPTSHGFVPIDPSNSEIINPLPDGTPQSPFIQLFEFVATADNSPYLCIQAALKFREVVCGGEEKIQAYSTRLARETAKKAEEAWGTEIMATDHIDKSAMIQVRLPVLVGSDGAGGNDGVGAMDVTEGPTEWHITEEEAVKAAKWISDKLVTDCNTFAAIFVHGNKLWVRFSGQIYLEMADMEKGIADIGKLCGRVREGKWKE